MRLLSLLLHRISLVAMAGCLSGMGILVLMQVAFRYLLELPLYWTEEAARYLLVWASFLGAAAAFHNKQHIALNLVVGKLPPAWAAAVRLVARLLLIAFFCLLLYGGIKMLYLTSRQLSPALRLSMAIPYAAVPVGAGLMLIHALAAPWREDGA